MQKKAKAKNKEIIKTAETKIPEVFFYVEKYIIKKMFEGDLEKLRKVFRCEICEDRDRFIITSDNISNCRKCCLVLEKIVNLIDSNIEPTDDDINEFINDYNPKPYKDSKYKGFFTTYKNEDISPRTENQELIVDNIKKNTITIVSGKAGTGKTKISIVTALNFLKDGRYDSISIVRPNVTVGNSWGYLPGDLDEKYSAYTTPIVENILELVGEVEYKNMLESKKIKFIPLGFIRGGTLQDTIVLADEIQNLTKHEILTLLTRMGINVKFIGTGDLTQFDLKMNKGDKNGLESCLDCLQDISGIGFVKMQECDIQRNKLVGEIIRAFE